MLVRAVYDRFSPTRRADSSHGREHGYLITMPEVILKRISHRLSAVNMGFESDMVLSEEDLEKLES